MALRAPLGCIVGSTDNADGTEGIFGARAHRDDSCPDPALTRERDLDPSVRRNVCALRARPASARGPCWAARDVVSTLRT